MLPPKKTHRALSLRPPGEAAQGAEKRGLQRPPRQAGRQSWSEEGPAGQGSPHPIPRGRAGAQRAGLLGQGRGEQRRGGRRVVKSAESFSFCKQGWDLGAPAGNRPFGRAFLPLPWAWVGCKGKPTGGPLHPRPGCPAGVPPPRSVLTPRPAPGAPSRPHA